MSQADLGAFDELRTLIGEADLRTRVTRLESWIAKTFVTAQIEYRDTPETLQHIDRANDRAGYFATRIEGLAKELGLDVVQKLGRIEFSTVNTVTGTRKIHASYSEFQNDADQRHVEFLTTLRVTVVR